jgi:AcrR family transcriptional regulator
LPASPAYGTDSSSSAICVDASCCAVSHDWAWPTSAPFGSATGALYYNFSGKEELFLELLNTTMSREIATRVEEVTRVFSEAEGDDDPFEALSGFVARRAGRNRQFAALSAEFWLYAVRTPAAMDLIAAKFSGQDRELEPLVAAAMDRFGTPPGMSPAEMTMVALMLFRSLAQRRRIDPAAVPDDLYARVLRRLFAGTAEPENTSPPPGESDAGR